MITRRLISAGAGLTLLWGITACSEDEPAEPTTPSQSVESPTDPGDGRVTTGLIDEDAYRRGLKTMLDTLGASDETTGDEDALEDYLTCLVDTTFDDMSDKGRRVIAAGNAMAHLDPEDKQVLIDGVTTCTAGSTP